MSAAVGFWLAMTGAGGMLAFGLGGWIRGDLYGWVGGFAFIVAAGVAFGIAGIAWDLLPHLTGQYEAELDKPDHVPGEYVP